MRREAFSPTLALRSGVILHFAVACCRRGHFTKNSCTRLSEVSSVKRGCRQLPWRAI